MLNIKIGLCIVICHGKRMLSGYFSNSLKYIVNKLCVIGIK